jgi:Bacterial protein of unknown function (DUF937)
MEVTTMATNLVTSIMQSLTPDMIAKIASLLGIDRNVAEKAIGAGIPAILAGFTNLASSPDGARQLSSTLLQQPAGALDQITSAIGSGQRGFAESGAGLLSGLLGSGGTNALATAVGSFAGIGTNNGKSLLGLLGPVVAGALGQQQRSAGLDANGLASLLTSQKDQIAAAMPSGFAKLLSGTGVVGAVDGGVRRTAETISAARGRMADMADDAVTSTGQAAYAASRGASASSSWPYLALAALVAAVGIGWYFLSDHDTQQVAQQKTAPPTLTSETVGARPPNVTAAELTTELTSSVGAVRAALQGMTNPETARAALPQLQQATARLDKINLLAAQLPPAARQGIAATLAPTMAPLNQLFDKVLATPEVAGVAKPAIDALRSRLETLSRT